jgi:hypothetical protein
MRLSVERQRSAFAPPLRRCGGTAEQEEPARHHAEVELFLARRGSEVTGRFRRYRFPQHTLPPEQGMGPGTGNWGMFDAEDEAVSAALIAAAEDWLRARGMTRVLAPMNLSIWEEPGLLVKGHDHPPMVLMGHQPPKFQPH